MTDIVLGALAFAAGSLLVGVVAIDVEMKAVACELNKNDLSLHFTSYFGAIASYQHIDFAAHTKLRKINSRLNRKQAVRKNAALVVDFQVIHVRAIGVNFRTNGVPGAVHKVVSKSGLLHPAADRLV